MKFCHSSVVTIRKIKKQTMILTLDIQDNVFNNKNEKSTIASTNMTDKDKNESSIYANYLETLSSNIQGALLEISNETFFQE